MDREDHKRQEIKDANTECELCGHDYIFKTGHDDHGVLHEVGGASYCPECLEKIVDRRTGYYCPRVTKLETKINNQKTALSKLQNQYDQKSACYSGLVSSIDRLAKKMQAQLDLGPGEYAPPKAQWIDTLNYLKRLLETPPVQDALTKIKADPDGFIETVKSERCDAGNLTPTQRAAVVKVRDRWQRHLDHRVENDNETMHDAGWYGAFGCCLYALAAALAAEPEPQERVCAVCGKHVEKDRYVCYPCTQFAAAMGKEPMMPVRVVVEVLHDGYPGIGDLRIALNKVLAPYLRQPCPTCGGDGQETYVATHWDKDDNPVQMPMLTGKPCPTCGGMRSVPFGKGIPQGEDQYDACPTCAKPDPPKTFGDVYGGINKPDPPHRMCAKCGKYPAEKCFTICEFCMDKLPADPPPEPEPCPTCAEDGIPGQVWREGWVDCPDCGNPDPPPLTTEDRARCNTVTLSLPMSELMVNGMCVAQSLGVVGVFPVDMSTDPWEFGYRIAFGKCGRGYHSEQEAIRAWLDAQGEPAPQGRTDPERLEWLANKGWQLTHHELETLWYCHAPAMRKCSPVYSTSGHITPRAAIDAAMDKGGDGK